MVRLAWTLLAITLILSGCGTSTGGGAATPTLPTSPGAIVVASPSPESPPAVQAALADAAAQLGVGASQLHVDQVTPRDWPDSSLGCPRPDEMYSQIVTPGYLIIITSAGKRLEYHSDTQSRVVLCSES